MCRPTVPVIHPSDQLYIPVTMLRTHKCQGHFSSPSSEPSVKLVSEYSEYVTFTHTMQVIHRMSQSD